jgi:hypothetical protein
MEYIHVFSMEYNGISWNVFMERGMFICLNSFFANIMEYIHPSWGMHLELHGNINDECKYKIV